MASGNVVIRRETEKDRRAFDALFPRKEKLKLPGQVF